MERRRKLKDTEHIQHTQDIQSFTAAKQSRSTSDIELCQSIPISRAP
jgi:hypothetical protein